MKYLTKQSAIEGVRKIFKNPDKGSVTLDEAFVAWDRQNYNQIENLRWIGNKLTHWKYHNLVKPIYGHRNGKRILSGIQLTLPGKQSLDNSAITDGESLEEQKLQSSLLEIMKLVESLKNHNPSYEITFDVKLRNKE